MSTFTDLLDAIPLETVEEVVNICEKFTEDVTTRFGDITCAVSEDGSEEISPEDFFERDIADIIGREPTITEITPGKKSLVANKESISTYNQMRARLARKTLGRQNSWHGRTNSGNKRRKRHSSCTDMKSDARVTGSKKSTNTNTRRNTAVSGSKQQPDGRVFDTISTDSGVSVRTRSRSPSHPYSTSSCPSVFSDTSPDKNVPVFCTVYKLTYTHTETSLRYAAPYTWQYSGLVAMVTDMTSYYRADVVTCYYVQGNELELKDSYSTSQSDAQRG